MKRPLNIVFFPHSANFGLAGTNRLQNIIYYLRKDHPEVSISNIALEDKTKLFYQKVSDLYVENYKELYYAPKISNFFKHIPETVKYLYKFRKKGFHNVIYFYGEIDIKNFFFVIWAKMLGFKIIIDVVEDLETYVKYKSFKNKVKYKSAVFFRKRLNYFGDGFTVVSRFLEGKIKNMFPGCSVFFLPVTMNKYLIASNPPKEKTNKITIFYSGSFNEKDGLSYLLAALKDLKEEGKSFRFLLSGKGSEKEMADFWDHVQQLDLKEEIDYQGFLSRARYVEILNREADVLCMTRINSAYANAGFPFKLGEFLMSGKPVIASKIGDVESYIGNEDAYLVAPENSGEIKNAILAMMENPAKAEKKGINGRNAALKHFDHEKYAAGLLSFMYLINGEKIPFK